MKTIVITGSTRGIGFGLADAFLERGCAVVISGRVSESVNHAVEELSSKHDPACVMGQPCDVTDYQQLQALWDATANRFEHIDIWINNAGLGNIYRPAWLQTPEQMESIISTNVLGTMYGTTVAYRAMLQQNFGQIFNMLGAGSDGRTKQGMTIYGSSKAGIDYFTRSMLAEVSEDSPVLLGTLSPGMVVTDLLTHAYEDPTELEKYKSIFNIIADRVEAVSPWLADRILANKKQGAQLKYLPRPKLVWRFISAPFSGRDLFSEN